MAARRLPSISGKAAIRVLQRAGFELDRVKGSHHALIHHGPPFRLVSVPVHGNKPLAIGTLADILKRAGLSVDDFLALM